MPAHVLVVDDDPANVEVLKAKLEAEYFRVSTAADGKTALAFMHEDCPDIVLLDVMMPGLDGCEVCRRIRATPSFTHLPVIMVTALGEVDDRIRGLEAGADDFLTKPVDDVALFARVRSLTRLKMMMDELSLRGETGAELGVIESASWSAADYPSNGRILVIDDDPDDTDLVADALAPLGRVIVEPDSKKGLELARNSPFDLIITSLMQKSTDGLRLSAELRTDDRLRPVSVLALADGDNPDSLLRALDIGVNDYLLKPIDRNELLARCRTQIRRKKLQDGLRANYRRSVVMAVTDSLTGLYNRDYMMTHLAKLFRRARESGRSLAVLMIDIDFFKSVNDTLGHAAGDAVLREFSSRLISNVRGLDLASRYGGEEFVIIVPGADPALARGVAERLRKAIASAPFRVSPVGEPLTVTASIGIAALERFDEEPSDLIARADQALYEAKRRGRNRVATGLIESRYRAHDETERRTAL